MTYYLTTNSMETMIPGIRKTEYLPKWAKDEGIIRLEVLKKVKKNSFMRFMRSLFM